MQRISSVLKRSKNQVNIRELVISDLKELHSKERNEKTLLEKCSSKREQGKRMLYLFQYDLLPGISGKILESKSTRDNKSYGAVSQRTKILGFLGVSICNAGMIFDT